MEDQPTLTREPGTGRQLVRSTGTSGDAEEVTWWRCLCGKKRSWSKTFETMRLMTEGLGGVCVVTIAFWVLYEFINPNSQKEEKTNSWVSQHSINYISNSSLKLKQKRHLLTHVTEEIGRSVYVHAWLRQGTQGVSLYLVLSPLWPSTWSDSFSWKKEDYHGPASHPPGVQFLGRSISFQDIPAKGPLCLVGPNEVTCHSESLMSSKKSTSIIDQIWVICL